MLFDKDEDGVLAFPELELVMKALGQRPSGENGFLLLYSILPYLLEMELLRMVREVSEDHTYDTIEFNEFLQMMSKQMTRPINTEDLIDAFRYRFICVVGLPVVAVCFQNV